MNRSPGYWEDTRDDSIQDATFLSIVKLWIIIRIQKIVARLPRECGIRPAGDTEVISGWRSSVHQVGISLWLPAASQSSRDISLSSGQLGLESTSEWCTTGSGELRRGKIPSNISWRGGSTSYGLNLQVWCEKGRIVPGNFIPPEVVSKYQDNVWWIRDDDWKQNINSSN